MIWYMYIYIYYMIYPTKSGDVFRSWSRFPAGPWRSPNAPPGRQWFCKSPVAWLQLVVLVDILGVQMLGFSTDFPWMLSLDVTLMENPWKGKCWLVTRETPDVSYTLKWWLVWSVISVLKVSMPCLEETLRKQTSFMCSGKCKSTWPDQKESDTKQMICFPY